MSQWRFNASGWKPQQPPSPGGPSHAEKEMQLFDYLDGKLSAPEARQVEAHLSACAHCAALRENWRPLEAGLGRAEHPSLSPDFERRTWLRISEQSREGLKEDLGPGFEAEWDEKRGRMRRGFPLSQILHLLDYVGLTMAAGLVCYFLYGGPMEVMAHSLGWRGSAQDWMLGIGGGASLVVLLCCLALVARKRTTRWLSWL